MTAARRPKISPDDAQACVGQVRRFENGCRLVVVPRPHLGRAHVAVMHRGGPVHEDDATWGLSHVLEHMVFRGAGRKKDTRAVSLAADAFGGEVGGATYRDRVVYDSRVDADKVADSLGLLHEMLAAPRFEGLAVEKDVIEEELLELYDDDGREIDADNLSFRRLFDGDVLGRSIEGTPRHLHRLDLRALRRFHARAVSPAHIVVAVAGPVDTEAITAAAKRTFGRLAQGAEAPVGAPLPTLRKGAVDVVKTDVSQTSVRLSFEVPGLNAPERAVVQVLTRLLDDGPASRLQAEVIDKEGLCYSLWADADLYERRGAVEIGALVRHDRVGRLVEAVVAEVVGLAARAPSPVELARVKMRHRRDVRDMLDDPASLAESAARGVLMSNGFDARAACDAFEAVGGAAVRSLAARLMTRDRARLVLVGRPGRKETARATRALDRLPEARR